jgi:hypothetical protein
MRLKEKQKTKGSDALSSNQHIKQVSTVERSKSWLARMQVQQPNQFLTNRMEHETNMRQSRALLYTHISYVTSACHTASTVDREMFQPVTSM